MEREVKVLVLGASGMLGNAVLRLFAQSPGHIVVGSARSAGVLRHLPRALHEHVICGVDVENPDSLVQLFTVTKPDVVINCIGLVKQLAQAEDPLAALPINALLPHRLVRLCELVGARFIHVSTDCVFAGTRGMYREEDAADATDLYGRSKLLGEVDQPHAVTLRTSIIGHELQGAHGLVNWFLSQNGLVKGYRRAIFSGLPTVELARVMRDIVIPRPELHGLYHVSAAPISKFDLLKLVAREYAKSIQIDPDDALMIDRSLDSTRFRTLSGYTPASWPELVHRMRQFDPATNSP
ncbi:MAG: SDR family oxidoreductase [Burkholderiales bacterium]